MDKQEIKETSIWQLYEKGRNYHRQKNVYTDTDRNYRMYNGNQWEGVKLGDSVEPVQINFIKPIVKYKVAVIHDNLYAINYSSQNFRNQEFAKMSVKYCDMLNRYAHRVWETEKMDFKGRKITVDSAVNDEGIIYVNFDKETMLPVNEVIDKADIYYGNENDDDIQNQPYIIFRKRMPVSSAIEFALDNGVGKDKIELIVGDNDTFEESGEAAKEEVDNMVTLVYKMYKQNGTVHFSAATRLVDIIKDTDIGISLYPVAHFNWEDKKGSARGEGEVRYLIPNQIEVNKVEMRRVLVAKLQSYPKTVADVSKISNPQALNTVGAIIKTQGATVDDVNKIIGTIQPAQMSSDVKLLRDDLMQTSRDLAGAGDSATGEIDPESASGRAILAVQNASRQPMTAQKEAYKNMIEDIAKIWLEYLIAYSTDGIDLEDEITDETGETSVQVVRVPQSVLKELQATVKIDVTPKSVYDKFAQEQTLENMLVQGLFNIQRLPELEAYVYALDDDSVAPKQKLLDIIERMKNEQRKIAQIETQTQLMQQQANRFLMDDPDGQAQQMADAQREQTAMEEIKRALAQARANGELDEETEEEVAEEDLPVEE